MVSNLVSKMKALRSPHAGTQFKWHSRMDIGKFSKVKRFELNIDMMLADGKYGTDGLALIRTHEADFTVDGLRLGSIDFETETRSIHDPRLSKGRAELESAAIC